VDIRLHMSGRGASSWHTSKRGCQTIPRRTRPGTRGSQRPNMRAAFDVKAAHGQERLPPVRPEQEGQRGVPRPHAQFRLQGGPPEAVCACAPLSRSFGDEFCRSSAEPCGGI
jgi:hypothetical protein